MAFDVLVTDEAFADLDSLAEFIRCQSSIEVSRKWFSSMIDAIASLSAMPDRCPLAPDAALFGSGVRLLLHGRKIRKYKIYFRIRRLGRSGGIVEVLHIRHWARNPLSGEETER
jgi:plasmid stabilization system protein ParE